MRTVVSDERTTGMGASRSTRVLCTDGNWYKVSAFPARRYMGRDCGVERYELDIAEGDPTALFYRSNSGKEQVAITLPDGSMENLASFEEAGRWGQGWVIAHPATP